MAQKEKKGKQSQRWQCRTTRWRFGVHFWIWWSLHRKWNFKSKFHTPDDAAQQSNTTMPWWNPNRVSVCGKMWHVKFSSILLNWKTMNVVILCGINTVLQWIWTTLSIVQAAVIKCQLIYYHLWKIQQEPRNLVDL